MPLVPSTNYPSLAVIANLVRSQVNDDKAGATGTPGEGKILTNTSVTLQNFMNSAIRDTYRDLRIMGQKVLIKDNYLCLGLPPVNSYLGVGVPNPAVQTSLQFSGWFDGLQMWPDWTLPSDFLLPLEVWSRQTGGGPNFGEVPQASGALCPRLQDVSIGEWEYRTDGIWFNGSTVQRDLRLRYICTYVDLVSPDIDWETTYVPIMDSEECIADKIAVKYASRLGGDALADAKATAKESVFKLYQQWTRARQKANLQRKIFGSGAGNSGSPANFLF